MKLYSKYMVSLRCKMIVKEALGKLSIPFVIIDLGMAETEKILTPEQCEQLKKLLESGLELLETQKSFLIEKIKNVIIEMIHHSEALTDVNYSDYLSEKLGYN